MFTIFYYIIISPKHHNNRNSDWFLNYFLLHNRLYLEWRSPSRVEKMEERFTQNIDASGHRILKGRSFLAEGFMNKMYVFFPFNY